MARSRHSVAWRQMSHMGQSHRQQRRPRQLHRSHRRLMSGTDGRLPGSQQHRDEHSDQQQWPHPRTLAHRQSRGWQKRQANRIAAQRSQIKKERTSTVSPMQRHFITLTTLHDGRVHQWLLWLEVLELGPGKEGKTKKKVSYPYHHHLVQRWLSEVSSCLVSCWATWPMESPYTLCRSQRRMVRGDKAEHWAAPSPLWTDHRVALLLLPASHAAELHQGRLYPENGNKLKEPSSCHQGK